MRTLRTGRFPLVFPHSHFVSASWQVSAEAKANRRDVDKLCPIRAATNAVIFLGFMFFVWQLSSSVWRFFFVVVCCFSCDLVCYLEGFAWHLVVQSVKDCVDLSIGGVQRSRELEMDTFCSFFSILNSWWKLSAEKFVMRLATGRCTNRQLHFHCWMERHHRNVNVVSELWRFHALILRIRNLYF
jgi:hypothetical protein